MNIILVTWVSAIAWCDWRYRRVPNVALLLLLVPAVLALIVNGNGLLGVERWPSFMGFLLAGGVLLPGYALGKMGAGDVKFAACLGLLLGSLWPTVRMMLVFGIALGAISVLMLWHYRQDPDAAKKRIAAAPALAIGFASQLFADQLLWFL